VEQGKAYIAARKTCDTSTIDGVHGCISSL